MHLRKDGILGRDITMKTILIIDDDFDCRFALRQYIRDRFRVLDASTGQEGIRIAADEKPDLIILDLSMPGMDGFEVCDRLRANPRTRRTPIIILTGDASRESRLKGLELGADDYLSRPFDGAELFARIQARLRRFDLDKRADLPLRVGNLKLDPKSFEVEVSEQLLSLTQVEFDLLRYFLERPDQVIERNRALRDLWCDSKVTERTVDTHVAHLRKKLHSFSCSIDTVYKVGYMLKTRGPHVSCCI
jgi:DNA-binding response OmpR family regulator